MTAARKPHSEEMSGRFRRYLISMTIRTLAVALAIFVFHGWLRLVCLLAGLALPWLAVVLANAGPVEPGEQPGYVAVRHDELPSGDPDAGGDPPGYEYSVPATTFRRPA